MPCNDRRLGSAVWSGRLDRFAAPANRPDLRRLRDGLEFGAAAADRGVSRCRCRGPSAGFSCTSWSSSTSSTAGGWESLPGSPITSSGFPSSTRQWLDAQLTPAAGRQSPSRSAPRRATSRHEPGATLPRAASRRGRPSPGRLGKFQLLERVGVGGFGTVWRALDLRLEPDRRPQGPARASDRKRRGRCAVLPRSQGGGPAPASRDRHGSRGPGLDGLPVLVCDFVTGTSLRDLIATRRLAHLTAAATGGKDRRCAGLRSFHGSHSSRYQAGQHHARHPAPRGRAPRATSSSLWPGEPRIVDFGLAFLDQEAIHLTHDGAIIGTPAYMSPEQAAGRDSAHPIDHRTDIYSLGVVLYELLTGAIPFAGTRIRGSLQGHRLRAAEPPPARPCRSPRPGEHLPEGNGQGAAAPLRLGPRAGRRPASLPRGRAGPSPPDQPLANAACGGRSDGPRKRALGLMGTVTVLAMIGLAIGYRYHLRLERLFQTTESARHAETQERRRAESFLYFHRMALAEREWTANNIDRVERLLEDCPPSLRGWEWRYLKRQCHHDLISLNHALSSTQVMDGYLRSVQPGRPHPCLLKQGRNGPALGFGHRPAHQAARAAQALRFLSGVPARQPLARLGRRRRRHPDLGHDEPDRWCGLCPRAPIRFTLWPTARMDACWSRVTGILPWKRSTTCAGEASFAAGTPRPAACSVLFAVILRTSWVWRSVPMARPLPRSAAPRLPCPKQPASRAS